MVLNAVPVGTLAPRPSNPSQVTTVVPMLVISASISTSLVAGWYPSTLFRSSKRIAIPGAVTVREISIAPPLALLGLHLETGTITGLSMVDVGQNSVSGSFTKLSYCG